MYILNFRVDIYLSALFFYAVKKYFIIIICCQSLPSNVYVGTHRYWSIVSQRWGTYGAVFIFPINTDKYNFTLTKNPIIPTSGDNITVDDYNVIVNPGYVDVQFKVGNIGDTVTCVFNVTPK